MHGPSSLSMKPGKPTQSQGKFSGLDEPVLASIGIKKWQPWEEDRDCERL